MMRRRFLILGAILAGIAMAGLAPPARADFELRYSTDGGTTWTQNDVAGSTNVLFIGATMITATTSTNALQGASVDLVLSGAFSSSTDLIIQATLAGILTSPPPEILNYTYTGSNSFTVSNPGNSVNTFVGQSWIDQANNSQYDPAHPSNPNPLFGPGGAGVIANTLSQPIPSSGGIVFSGMSPYALTTQLHLNITVAAGADSVSADLNNTITVPAPAGLALVAMGLPFLAIGRVRRRKA